MNLEIYYFSGTGNSLAVARDIAEKMGGDLISIPSVMDKKSITTDADVIGIVFPVYYLGTVNIPLVVQRFVMKLDGISTKYIFAVCTFGGGAGSTLAILDEMIKARGGRLASGFGVQMPQNAFRKPFENKTKLYSNWKEKKLDFICEHVKAKDGWFDTDGLFIGLVVAIIERMMKVGFLNRSSLRSMKKTARLQEDSDFTLDEVIRFMDRSYSTDENCTGCGTCSKVCQVRNIEIVDNKPAWQHHCENCLACIKWCPQSAIHGYGKLPGGYHHPDVDILDMLRES
ncbi:MULTISPECIES: EFR1 family ferrodoxin [Methanobacterium]|jgi:flavodoxin/ferredoxin|uniref:EFR1 family ferrodoxin n=1 Tax=Methanobacterium veterum TaxID=408577 RepID=A0A9E5DK65_9EURY|nr:MULTISPECIES: EFR1 family ferrodoxin [Methanobacterium]MCZ3365953.1 EFR1 family ferrodoxin [Methanobacterium veterum]MCZ3371418.1 EFR1 family ferrodoxin [Methanobacterium veterum]